jgi:hypothetical protein
MEEAVMSKSELPRGIRNHNPGNIDKGANNWQGLDKSNLTNESRFATFVDPTWGIRAMAVTLITYQDKYTLCTVRDIISRWAPSTENDTLAYIGFVCKQTKFGPDEILNMHDYDYLCPMVEAIIRHENGRGPKSTPNTWYDRATVDTALQRAGVVKKTPVVAAVPVTKETVGATGSAGLGIAQLADQAPVVMQAMDSQQDHLNSGSYVRIFFGVAMIGLAVFIAYSQVKKHQSGVVA